MINFKENAPVASVEKFSEIQAQKAIDILFNLMTNQDRAPNAFYKIIVDSELVENK